MSILDRLRGNLRLPAIAAPMFLVSGPEMVVAACKAGVIGAFPTPNARTTGILEQWLCRIEGEVSAAPDAACFAANLVVHRSNARRGEDLAAIIRHRVPLVITALGSPREVVDAVHGYGGAVFADVNSLAFARKPADTRDKYQALHSLRTSADFGVARLSWAALSRPGAASARRKSWAPTSLMSEPRSLPVMRAWPTPHTSRW